MVGDGEAVVDVDDPAKTAALWARSQRGVEGEKTRGGGTEGAAGFRRMQPARIVAGLGEDLGGTPLLAPCCALLGTRGLSNGLRRGRAASPGFVRAVARQKKKHFSLAEVQGGFSGFEKPGLVGVRDGNPVLDDKKVRGGPQRGIGVSGEQVGKLGQIGL